MNQEIKLFVDAARAGDRQAVRLGLEQGLRADHHYGSGFHPLVLAAEFNFPDLVDRFHKTGICSMHDYAEALHIAAEQGNRDLVFQIIDYGFNPAETAHFDLGMAAAIGGQIELLREFDRRNIRTDYKDPILLTAVIEHDHGDILDFILDQGADLGAAQKEVNRLIQYRGISTVQKCRQTLKGWRERRVAMAAQGHIPKTLKELREKTYENNGTAVTGLLRLARAGRFAEVIAIARESGNDCLRHDDLLSTDRHGNTIIEILGARGELKMLFDQSIWKNGMNDIKTLYAMVPETYRAKLDIQPLISSHHASNIRRRKNPSFRL